MEFEYLGYNQYMDKNIFLCLRDFCVETHHHTSKESYP